MFFGLFQGKKGFFDKKWMHKKPLIKLFLYSAHDTLAFLLYHHFSWDEIEITYFTVQNDSLVTFLFFVAHKNLTAADHKRQYNILNGGLT